MSTASVRLVFRKQMVFYTGIGLSIISAFKAVLDLFLLDTFERSISLLIVGIQIIVYVVVIGNMRQDYFKDDTEITHNAEEIAK